MEAVDGDDAAAADNDDDWAAADPSDRLAEIEGEAEEEITTIAWEGISVIISVCVVVAAVCIVCVSVARMSLVRNEIVVL